MRRVGADWLVQASEGGMMNLDGQVVPKLQDETATTQVSKHL